MVAAGAVRLRVSEGGPILNTVNELLHNRTLVAPLVAWLLAQFLKVPFSFSRESGFDFQRMVSSGGMPSAHSALVTSLATITGLVSGWGSPLFAVTVVMAMIVMYDAAGVRQAAGEQARILNQIMREWRTSKSFKDIKLHELLGHTPNEVLVGALLGIVTAIISFYL
jgi:acid phosphatase family membrane protein YuiD